ncbi:MAG: hypothetical protein OXT09_11910 [Myxococcales bacterium]|nr:hypothetical protein [Myxococcales bacterium]
MSIRRIDPPSAPGSRAQRFAAGALVLASALALGCSNETGGPEGQGGLNMPIAMGGAGGPAPAAPTGDGTMMADGMTSAPPAGGATFVGTIVESVNDMPVPSSQLELTVRVLDNVTGMPLAGLETVTDDNAVVSFPGLTQDQVGFMIQGVPDQAIDTYTFNVSPLEQDKLLRVVAKSSVLTVKTVANVTLDPQMADIAGAIYWDSPDGLEHPVGCVTVSIDDGQGDIRYFASNNLPTTNVALDSAPYLEVRTATNPLNGRFYIANVVPGAHTVTAMLNGEVVGEASLPAFAGNMSSDGENAISLTDITLSAPANPTPADCM